MEKNFTNENFERFLRQNTDGLRMRPSAKVWKSISSHLNKRRRRIGFILGCSLLLTTGLGYYAVVENNSANELNPVATNPPLTQKKGKTENNSSRLNLSLATIVSVDKEKNENSSPESYIAKTASGDQLPDAITNGALTNQSGDNVMELNTASTSAFNFTPTVVDSYFENEINPNPSELQRISLADPLTIESVINSYKQSRKSKVGLQIYFTPTVSYRRLSDSKIDYITPNKPEFGFEVGMAAKYPIAKNIKLRAGVQFNINRYEIKTNTTFTESATIKLTDRNRVDFLKIATNFNNNSGYRVSWLKNFYFQVSAPVGVEIKLTGNDKTQFGIATTVQPTYILAGRAYLISADYNNYAEVPKLVRRWNVNTNLETFVTYSTGKLKWQVGPQVRYQLLSSYLKKYPVKENLFDFGFKVGLSLNNR